MANEKLDFFAIASPVQHLVRQGEGTPHRQDWLFHKTDTFTYFRTVPEKIPEANSSSQNVAFYTIRQSPTVLIAKTCSTVDASAAVQPLSAAYEAPHGVTKLDDYMVLLKEFQYIQYNSHK